MATKKKTATKSGGNSGVVGINTNGINKMQEAIDAYINAVKKDFKVGIMEANIQKGIKGSNSVNTLSQLSKVINDKMQNYVSGLSKFKDQLETVKTQYINADENNTVFKNVSTRIENK